MDHQLKIRISSCLSSYLSENYHPIFVYFAYFYTATLFLNNIQFYYTYDRKQSLAGEKRFEFYEKRFARFFAMMRINAILYYASMCVYCLYYHTCAKIISLRCSLVKWFSFILAIIQDLRERTIEWQQKLRSRPSCTTTSYRSSVRSMVNWSESVSRSSQSIELGHSR